MARRLSLLLLGIAVLLAPAAGYAQDGPPNALQGFSKNRDLPVKIDAGSLEVRDKSKIATFSGNVQVVQGDTTLRSRSLQVFYDQETDGTPNAMTAAKPGPAGQGKIRRLVASGNVIVTQKDQTATGDSGIFDMAANTVTLSGNVVVAQGQSVLRGDRLTVNLETGVSHVESGKGGSGRVTGVFTPSSIAEQKNGKGANKNDDHNKNDNAAPKNSAAQAGSAATPSRKPMHPSGLY